MVEMEEYEDELPSYSFKKNLLHNFEFNEMKSAFKSDKPEDVVCWEHINKFNSILYFNYHTIVNSHCRKDQNTKCCRDINYYLDLIIGIVRSSKVKEVDKREYIEKVENYWKDRFKRITDYYCKREEDNYSKEQRSILKHLYDVCDDKEMSNINGVMYKHLLENKWTKIINSNSSNSKDLFFHINGKTLNIKGTYRDFLSNFEGINCTGYKNINLSDILLKSESFEKEPPVDISDSHGGSPVIEVIPNSFPEEHVMKTENSTSNILDLKKLPIIFVSLSGIGSFFFILYKV